MFPLLRYFSIASLVAVVLTTLLLGLLHHQAERQQLLHLGESNHVALTQSFANSLLPSFRQLIEATKDLKTEELRAHPLAAELRPRIVEATGHTQVIKVKLYDLQGRTVFSTEAAQIGKFYGENPGFRSALGGQPLSELTHRDRFSAFDREIVDRDVLSSYVALRATEQAPIEGVLEVYSDVTRWIAQSDRQANLVTLATVLAFGLLYAALHVIVRRADRLLRTQYEQLRRSESELAIAATVFESNEAMLVTDTETRIIRANRTLLEATGFSAEELLGQRPNMIGSSRHDDEFFRSIWNGVARTDGWRGELWGRRKNGEEYPAWFTLTAVRSTDRGITHYVGTLIDISERARAEEQIKVLAFYDQLTGLPNRTLMRDRLSHALVTSARSHRHGAVMFIDLDRFKEVNDSLGHDVGDLLLKEVARRLQASVRQCDTVSRWGGDEFIVMLENMDSEPGPAAEQVREIAGKILAGLNRAFQLGGQERRTTASIGAALFLDHGQSLDLVLKRADDAMYQAKSRGRNRMAIFGDA